MPRLVVTKAKMRRIRLPGLSSHLKYSTKRQGGLRPDFRKVGVRQVDVIQLRAAFGFSSEYKEVR